MSDYNTTTTTTINGGTKVTFGSESSHAPDIQGLDALHGNMGSGRLRVSAEGAVATESIGQTRVNVGQDFNDQRAAATSILDTARAPHGGRASKLSHSSIVMVDGMETSIGSAIQMGLVRQDASGNYVEVGQPLQQPAERQGQQHQADSGQDYFPVPEANMQALNEVIEPLPQVMFEQTVAKYLNFGPDSIDHKSLGATLGMDPSEVKARIEFAAQVFQAHAAQALKGVVSDPEDAMEWLAAERPKELARAMANVVHGHNVGELRSLAQTYVKSTDPEDSALKAAGFETRTERDGQRMIRIEGIWTPVRAAVKAGRI